MMTSFPPGGIALVIGAGGGIGQAVENALLSDDGFARVIGTRRTGRQALDLMDESSIAALAASVKASGLDLRLVFDATGYLHGAQGEPEKTWSAIDPAAMAHQFVINAIGPALLMKHFLPLLPARGKAVFATVSAKVGSISDNRLGGWYGYRAAKAALNQLVRTASIELARKRPDALVLALHPGTVATPLSQPFAKSGVNLQQPEQSAASMLGVVDRADSAQSGLLLSYDGTNLPY